MDLTFRTIDLDRHASVAARFRRDAYRVAFGSACRFDEVVGEKAYLRWLHYRIERSPRGQVHVWADDTIVGQIEARPHRTDPSVGHVNLYYLESPWRGRGFGAKLDLYVEDYFRNEGITKMSLNVSETNARAINFYLRRGWRQRETVATDLGQLRMERQLSHHPATVDQSN